MNCGSHQPARRVARKLRIGIKRDDVANLREQRLARGLNHEARISSAAQQLVEFVQLAAFSFPTHPLTFARIPLPPAMKQVETQRLTLAITLVQLLNAFEREVNQARVAGQLLGGRIGKVTE